MNFYIQMGHGMKSICKTLSEFWGGATVILSPLNYKESTLPSFSKDIQKTHGKILLDPQMYNPHKHHKTLEQYSYWPQSGIPSFDSRGYGEVLHRLYQLNNTVESDAFILPSRATDVISDQWHAEQSMICEHARKISNGHRIIHTIALSKDVLSDEINVERIIQYVNQWDIDGVYIVCEHPKRNYLIDMPLWISSLLSLVAGIKRLGKSVIIGYASHQMLCLALAKCDAIAAGHFLNVRWFQPERFETSYENEPSRRTTWYYCPQALSEYKVTFLDVANRPSVDLLSRMKPPAIMENPFSSMLFSGVTPSSTGYSETNSHLHYLHCLKVQCELSTRITYDETRDAHQVLLETAAHLTNGLRNERIRGQDRDFSDIVDVIEAAISLFDKEYGFAMSQEWDLL